MKIITFSSDKDFYLFAENFKKNGIEISCLVTECPKPEGRNLEVSPNGAHQYALDNGIITLHPEKLDNKFDNELQKIKLELGFIFSYGKIIPQTTIDLFEKGIFNIHFSLLPEYIGASPIQTALLNNKKITGFTVFKITDKLDHGDVLTRQEIDILEDDNFSSLRERIIEEALRTLADQLRNYATGNLKLEKMSDANRSFTKKFSKEDGRLLENDNAQSAYNKFRAFIRWPGVYFTIDGKRLLIREAKLQNKKFEIIKIQPEGKKTMSFADFKNGHYSLLTKFPDFVNIS